MEQYLNRGINQDKIFVSKSPSIAIWSLTRGCIVGEGDVAALEVFENRLTYENNRLVSLSVYDIHKYRFGFIPKI